MNKTITIYELLGLVKDGKAPKTIKYDTKEYVFRSYDYKEAMNDLIDEQSSLIECIDFYKFDEPVEIIENNDKLEKIKSLNNVGSSINLTEFEDKQHLNNHILKDKINKIIDHINKIEEEMRK